MLLGNPTEFCDLTFYLFAYFILTYCSNLHILRKLYKIFLSICKGIHYFTVATFPCWFDLNVPKFVKVYQYTYLSKSIV